MAAASESKALHDDGSAWQKMKTQMNGLEAQLTAAGKTAKLEQIAQQIVPILKANSHESEERNKRQLLQAIQDSCDAPTLQLIRDHVSEVESVSFEAHGKHGTRFRCSGIWFTWGPTRHRIAFGEVKSDVGDEYDCDFLPCSKFSMAPSEWAKYIKKWGKCSLTPAEIQAAHGDSICEAIETDAENIPELKLADFLLPIVWAFRCERFF